MSQKIMNANSLHKELTKRMTRIEQASGRLKAVISDSNRTNQACFKKYNAVEGKPWLTVEETYLLYDFVHLIKNIKNLWLTEKTSQLKFENQGKEYIADFQHVTALHKCEESNFFTICLVLTKSLYILSPLRDSALSLA